LSEEERGRGRFHYPGGKGGITALNRKKKKGEIGKKGREGRPVERKKHRKVEKRGGKRHPFQGRGGRQGVDKKGRGGVSFNVEKRKG